jgi:thiol-disulfide isomerase/thioredoxin
MSFGKDDPGPGDRIPDFDLPTLDGGRFRSADLAETGPVLLVFGSYTCPVTESAGPGLNQLHARFGDRMRFVMVNVREAHPGNNAPQPQNMIEKTVHAVQLRDVHGFDFEVAVDDIDGTLHRALSPKPNSAYIVDRDGTILFRAQWANDTSALSEALEAITNGKPLRRLQSTELIRPMLSMLRYGAPIFDRAGKGAWRDMWRVMPPLALMGIVLKTLRIGPKG